MTTAQELAFFQQRGFGRRIGFGLRPALLVIDMINAFTDPGMPLGANLDAQIAGTNQLLLAAHARDVPVIFSTVSYDDSLQKDAGIWALKQSGVSTLAAGSAGVLVDKRLDKRQSDGLLVKKYASCFFGTDLVSRLVAQGADTLIITGCTTSGCVRASAVDACQNGFRPMVVREAVGDRSETAHAQSLFDLDAKYADVVTLQDTLSYLQHQLHSSRP
jgi:maleamate amidohydrolase